MSSPPQTGPALQEIERIHTFFPILRLLGNRWAARRPWEGRVIATCAHLTTLTAVLLRELALGGGQMVVSAANPATTNPQVVALLRQEGMEVHTDRDAQVRHLRALEQNPDLLIDVGFSMIETLLHHRPELAAEVQGAIEITRTGITRMRAQEHIPFPVINVNDGQLKPAIENRHGAGEGLWQAVARLTGMHLSGRRVGVIGYGPVGQGVAAYAKAAGAQVAVVEVDPIRRLVAHYDGFSTPTLRDAIESVGILVTATGHSKIIRADDLIHARDGMVLVNAGHGGDEIDIDEIRRRAEEEDQIATHTVRYRIGDRARVVVLGNGHPLNIVTNLGSPEPILLHFALVGLTLDWLSSNELEAGEIMVPNELEHEAAALALDALGRAAG
jgi:adenosylhomocysteinase